MTKTLRIAVLLPLALLLPLAPANADDGDFTGGGTASTTPYVVPDHAKAEVAEKMRLSELIEQQLNAGAGTRRKPLRFAMPHRHKKIRGARTAACSPSLPDCNQPAYVYLAATNYREGGGNYCTPNSTGCSSQGRKYYTCAAAATRNMTATMTGNDKGELHFENGLGLSKSQGLLGINRIPDLLNRDYRAWGSWKTYAPTSATDYLSHIITDVRAYKQSVIQNVKTSELTRIYAPTVVLAHYDVAYGFNTLDGTVAIAEEWSPLWTFGRLSSSYQGRNPYGLWRDVPKAQGYNAVHASTNGKYVI